MRLRAFRFDMLVEPVRRAAMNGYVTKPVSPRALAEMLKKWLSGEQDVDQLKQDSENMEHDAGHMQHDAAHAKQKTVELVLPLHEILSYLPIFDRDGFIDRLIDDEDLARTVAAGFLDDIPRQITVLKECLAAGDASRAIRQVQGIKGAAGNMGGNRFMNAASQMEAAVKAGDLDIVAHNMADLEAQFDALKSALEKL